MKKLINKYQIGGWFPIGYDNNIYQPTYGTMLPEVKVIAKGDPRKINNDYYKAHAAERAAFQDRVARREGQDWIPKTMLGLAALPFAIEGAATAAPYIPQFLNFIVHPASSIATANGLKTIAPILKAGESSALTVSGGLDMKDAITKGINKEIPWYDAAGEGIVSGLLASEVLGSVLKSGKGLIQNYKNNQNFVNEVNKYFWEYPKLKPSISTKITNNRVKQRIAEDNTFLRGVRSSPNTEEVDKILKEKYGIYNPTEDDRLKFYATHFAGNTKHGRAGIPKELLDKNIGTLYTSNSAGTAYGYNTVNTRGQKLGESDGKVALVRRPYKLGNDRRNWIKESHIDFRSTDDIDFLTTPNFSNFENGFWTKERSQELFNLKLDEINPELKKLNLIDGAYTHNYKTLISNGYSEQEASNIMMLLDNVHNKAVNKLFQKYHVLPDLNSSEAIDFMKNNMFTTEDIISKEDYLKKLHYVSKHNKIVRNPKHKLPDVNMYQHYIFLGEPNTKGLDFIEWYDPGKNFRSGYRVHRGKNTKGLSRRQNRGESE